MPHLNQRGTVNDPFKIQKKGKQEEEEEADEEERRATECVLSPFLFRCCSMCAVAGEDNEETGRDASEGVRMKR